MNKFNDTAHSELNIPRRFTVPQRIEHAVLAISFTVLGVTGLPQKYAASPAANWLIEQMGGIEATRVIHRWAAVVFCVLAVYHAIALANKFIVQRVEMTMMPAKKDFADAFRLLGYNLFLTRKPPEMPRYNFAEKLEYWALVWGGIIMAVTGFMLWNPLITTRFLPGQFIPAAKAAHGGEAVLAVLAIIVWHFYNVHFKAFNKSMFTGKLTRHQMEEEHASELSGLVSVRSGLLQTPRARKHGRLVFVPVAIVIAAVGLGTIYWAATAETTAISTLPRAPNRPAASPVQALTPPPTPIVSAPLITHDIAGHEQCGLCHGLKGIKPMPGNHEGRPVASCRICHKPGPKPKRSTTPAEEKAAGGPAVIPHSVEGDAFKDCLQCHGAGKLKPFPSDHASYPVESCRACHQPAPGVK